MVHTFKRTKASRKTSNDFSNSTRPTPQTGANKRTVAATTSNAGSLRSNSRRSSLTEAVSFHVGASDCDDTRPAKKARLSNGSTDSRRTYSSKDGDCQKRRLQTALLPQSQQIRASESLLELNNPYGSISKSYSGTSNDSADDIGSALDASESTDRGIQQPPLVGPNSSSINAAKALESRGASPLPNVLTNNSLQSTPVRASFEDTQDSEKQESLRIVKRLPGRRRAPNPNVRIEADLRRQLQLRTTYRSVAKALKPILAELARRSIEDVQNDPEAHQRSDHFKTLNIELDLRLGQRLDFLKRSHQLELGNLKQKHESEQKMTKQQYKDTFYDIQTKFASKCKHDIRKTLRESQRQIDGDITDDEDSTIPQLHAATKLHESDDHPRYWSVAAGTLPEVFDSRSRRFIEAELRWHEMIRRFELRGLQQKYEPTSTAHQKGDFIVVDKDRRSIGVAILNLNTLAQALYMVEAAAANAISKVDDEVENKKGKVASNDETEALRLLAEVSEAVGQTLRLANKPPNLENRSVLLELPDTTTSPVTSGLRLRNQKHRPSTRGRNQEESHVMESSLQEELAEHHSVPNLLTLVNEQMGRSGNEEIVSRNVSRRPDSRQLPPACALSPPLAVYAESDQFPRRDGRVLPVLAAKPLISVPEVTSKNRPATSKPEHKPNKVDASITQPEKRPTANDATIEIETSEKRPVQQLPQRSEQKPKIASKAERPDPIVGQLTTDSDGVSQQPSQSTTPPGLPRYMSAGMDRRKPQITSRGLKGDQRPLRSLGTSSATAAQKGRYTSAHMSSNEAQPHLDRRHTGPHTWPASEQNPMVHTPHSHHPHQVSALNYASSYAASSRPDYGHGYTVAMSSHNAPSIDKWRRDAQQLQTLAPEYQTSYRSDYYGPPYSYTGQQAPGYDYTVPPFLAPRPAPGQPYAQDRYGGHPNNQSSLPPPPQPPPPSYHSYYRYQQPPASRHYSVPTLHAAQQYGTPILPATMDPKRARGLEPPYEQHHQFHHHHSQSYLQHAAPPPPPPPPHYVNAFPSDDFRRRNRSQSDQSKMNNQNYHSQYHR